MDTGSRAAEVPCHAYLVDDQVAHREKGEEGGEGRRPSSSRVSRSTSGISEAIYISGTTDCAVTVGAANIGFIVATPVGGIG